MAHFVCPACRSPSLQKVQAQFPSNDFRGQQSNSRSPAAISLATGSEKVLVKTRWGQHCPRLLKTHVHFERFRPNPNSLLILCYCKDVLSLVTPWFSFQRTRRDCSLGIGSTMPRVMRKAGLEENEFSASWDPPFQLACGRRQMSDKKLKVQVANLCWLAVASQTPREQNRKSRPCFSLFVFAWRVGYRPVIEFERKWLTWLRADSQNRMKAEAGTAESIRDFCSQRKKSGSGV